MDFRVNRNQVICINQDNVFVLSYGEEASNTIGIVAPK